MHIFLGLILLPSVLTTVEKCGLKPEVGNCVNRRFRWYFTNGRCKSFFDCADSPDDIFFHSRTACESECGAPVVVRDSVLEPCGFKCPPETTCVVNESGIAKCQPKEKRRTEIRPGYCDLPRDEGSCKDYIPSWFYSTESEDCDLFIFGGCEGNGNRFPTRTECRETCIRDDQVKMGRCPGEDSFSLEGCNRTCSSDANCPGLQKCCPTNCGSTCSLPISQDCSFKKPEPLQGCLVRRSGCQESQMFCDGFYPTNPCLPSPCKAKELCVLRAQQDCPIRPCHQYRCLPFSTINSL